MDSKQGHTPCLSEFSACLFWWGFKVPLFSILSSAGLLPQSQNFGVSAHWLGTLNSPQATGDRGESFKEHPTHNTKGACSALCPISFPSNSANPAPLNRFLPWDPNRACFCPCLPTCQPILASSTTVPAQWNHLWLGAGFIFHNFQRVRRKFSVKQFHLLTHRSSSVNMS